MDVVAVLQRVALAIVAAVANLLVTPMFSAQLLKEPTLSNSGYFTVFFYSWIVVTMIRPKYYVAWYLGEASAINAGFGHSGIDPKTNKHQWKQVEQAKMFSVEFGTNMYSMVNLWNMSVSRWLRNYVYCRIGRKPEPGKRINTTPNTFATFAVSAFWHGFYPGYYLFWLSAALLSEIGKELHRKIRPRVYRDGRAPFIVNVVYKLVGWLLTHFALNYSAVGFVLLSWTDTVAVYNRLSWGGHIAFLLTYLMLAYLVPRPRHSAAKQTDSPTTVTEKAQPGAKVSKTRKD